MRRFVIVLGLCTSIFTGISSVSAYVIDGLVNDWGVNLGASGVRAGGYLNSNAPLDGVDYVADDNADEGKPIWSEVGPGWTYKNFYDAEAIYFDNDLNYAYIAVVQGMPKEGHHLSGYPRFMPGDIGIDVDGDGAYEYGIDVSSFSSNKAEFYGNLTRSSWNGVYYRAHSVSSPWAIKSGKGTSLGKIDFIYSDEQNTHYVLEARIPLSYLGLTANPGAPISPLKIHWTQECGNDFLKLDADVNPLPEPSSLLLLITGLLGLGACSKPRSGASGV